MHASRSHEATDLDVSGGPIRSVTVVADPGMAGSIAVDLKADDEREVTAVIMRTKGSRLVIEVPPRNVQGRSRRGILDRILGRSRIVDGDLVGGRVQDAGDTRPTLDMAVRVPHGTPVRLSLSGNTRASVGDAVGDLRMDLAGAVQATVGSVRGVSVEASGNVMATLAATHGDLTVNLSGASEVEVAVAEAGNLDLTSSGAGVLKVRAGEFGNAKAELCGAGIVVVDAVVAGDLSFDGTGAFDAKFARVLGRSRTRKTGSGTVRIAGRKHQGG